MSGPLHVFVHVPRCAGTTVERHFARTLGPRFLLAPRRSGPLRTLAGAAAAADLAGVSVVSGHSLSRALVAAAPGRELQEHLLIRDPVSRLVSLYNYRLARHRERGEPAPPHFARWLRTQRRDAMTRFLLHRYLGLGLDRLYGLSSRGRFEALEAALTRFRFVGAHHRCADLIAAVSQELGVDPRGAPENVTADPTLRPQDLSDADRAAVLARNPVDALVFARWRDRGFADSPQAPGGVEEAAARLPDDDRLALAASDLLSAVRRTLWRP